MAGAALGGAGGARGRRRLGGMNEINVTPLIDVMLVLLVIFMVTAPLLTTGVHVDLPKVKSAPMQTDDSKLLVIITSDEHVYLGKDEITDDLLTSKTLSNVAWGALVRAAGARPLPSAVLTEPNVRFVQWGWLE